jgi:hypothetical protein
LGPQLPAALRERLTRILELAGCLLDLLDTKNLSIKGTSNNPVFHIC